MRPKVWFRGCGPCTGPSRARAWRRESRSRPPSIRASSQRDSPPPRPMCSRPSRRPLLTSLTSSLKQVSQVNSAVYVTVSSPLTCRTCRAFKDLLDFVTQAWGRELKSRKGDEASRASCLACGGWNEYRTLSTPFLPCFSYHCVCCCCWLACTLQALPSPSRRTHFGP